MHACDCLLRGCRSRSRTPTGRRPHFNITKRVGTLPTLIVMLSTLSRIKRHAYFRKSNVKAFLYIVFNCVYWNKKYVAFSLLYRLAQATILEHRSVFIAYILNIILISLLSFSYVSLYI